LIKEIEQNIISISSISPGVDKVIIRLLKVY
jgi:hypothetical protein